MGTGIAAIFGIQSIDYTALLPVLLVAAGALAVLLADLFLTEERKPYLAWATVAVLVAALIAETMLWTSRTTHPRPRQTFCTPSGCSYSVDNFTLTLQTLALAATVLVILMAPRRFKVPFGEYHFLVLCSLTGALVLVAARDFVTITVGLETLSLPAFALVGFGRRAGGEAALKFFLMSIASTAVMLFGISLIYGTTGTVFFQDVSTRLGQLSAESSAQDPVATTGIVLTLVGFAFKVSAVPFHFWTPEVYAGAPVPVAAYLSVISKAAGFAGLILTIELAFRTHLHSVGTLMAVLAAVTMTVGNVISLRQRSAVRLLAWSTVAQAGYILVPLAVTQGNTNPVSASVAYLVLYAVMNLGAFGVVSATFGEPDTTPASTPVPTPTPTSDASTAQPSAPRSSTTHAPTPHASATQALASHASTTQGPTPNSSTTQGLASHSSAPDSAAVRSSRPQPSGGELAAYRGLYRERPRSAFALAFFLLCLAGLPPGVMGLFAKVVVFKAAVGGDLVWLAVIMAVNVVIALYYYLRWAAILFDVSLFGAPQLAAPEGIAVPALPRAVPALAPRIAIGIAFVLAVVFSFWPNPALDAVTFWW